jgi:predicted nucleotidyltransferase
MTAEDVLVVLRTHLSELSTLGVRRIGVFGSVADGTSTADSDIDVLVAFEPGKKTFDNFMDLKFRLEELLPGRTIDLVLENAIKPAIREYIKRSVRYAA